MLFDKVTDKILAKISDFLNLIYLATCRGLESVLRKLICLTGSLAQKNRALLETLEHERAVINRLDLLFDGLLLLNEFTFKLVFKDLVIF